MSEQLTTSQTSSIRAVWPPEVDDTHHRLRGFYTEGVIRTAADIAKFTANFGRQQVLAQTPEGVDRLSIRAVAHAGALAALAQMNLSVEAALPLVRTEPDLVIAYTAANHGERVMSASHLAQHRALLAQATARPRVAKDRLSSLRSQGFALRLVDRQNAESLTSRFLGLYAAFGYNEAHQVTELLGNPANTIAYVERDGMVVSTAMAESATITVTGLPPLNLVEITEASTHPDFRGQGLYEAVSGYLVSRLLQERRDSNAVYGESRLAMPGVIHAAHQNGRQFSHFDADRYGIADPAFGVLQQNFTVADGAETRAYSDFAVSYVPLG